MWIRKFERDRKKGVVSPMPTQMVSNEEFIPRPQNDRQKELEHLITASSERNARRLGMDRRAFMSTSMGLATCFLVANQVYGECFDVDDAEAFEPAATEEKFPKGEYFVFDVQAHFTNGIAIGFRNMEFVRNMGFQLKESPEAYSFHTFVKEMFFDSETDMVVISGVPGPAEKHRGADGKVLEGKERAGGILPSWLMAQAKKEINGLSGSTRALCQGNLAPNHYWDKEKDTTTRRAP